ncbi:LPS assembly lipoprotein LptE [Shewanella sp. 3B26]|jgi:LPS-assembly lipoprotein|uniref:LPS-assembly lipoprotein LptE n=1 Tax=Shewanella zhuhaiensis TaxID=2919576 RepID=A0AAJ1BIZ9_9GAMM|nr:LPS assembly lipoprotein LptE [Shewanella zhuhaiensis]MCH4295705.1 LPS assembly lipoprotein LptE [Shewanella zhuhaiensis]
MVRILLTAILSLALLTVVTGCGFRLQGSYKIPTSLKTLSVDSADEYSELTRLVKDRLRLSGVQVVASDATIPSVRLIKDTLERTTLSLYPTGNVAEYELIYHVQFAVAIPGEEAKPFNVEIRRDYLDDPRTALAKSREMELLVKEMRQQAADNLIQTLAAIGEN